MLNNPAIWIGMEREWEIGTQLRAALEEPGGKLPGFMRMCDCLVRSDDPASGKAAFNGMILEKLNGWEVYKRIDNPEFHNIHYVREMLYQVFSALDRAQRKLGFHHADLGMRNVMEHYPRLWEDVEQPQPHGSPAGGCSPCAQQQHAQQQLGAAGADGGAAAAATAAPEQRASCFIEWAEAGEGYQLPERRQQPWWRRKAEGPGASCGKVRCRPGFSCNADGSRMPLGPNLEFKVIDFGVAVFDERLAQAAGGYESEAVMERLNEVFAAKRITFGSQGSQKGRMLEMATSEGAIPGGHKRDWHLVPTGFRNRWRVKTTPPGAKPIVSAHSLEAEGLPPPPVQAQRVPPQPAAQPPASPFAAAAADDDGATELPQRFRSATLLRRPGQGLEQASAAMRAGEAAEAAVLRASQSAGSEAGSGSVHSNPQHASSRPLTYRQSPIEQMYRRFWQRKGDVFHLLLGMALVLDDRVWPKEDERDVQLFISLVHHVTGVRMRASFAVEGQGNQPGIFGRLVCGSASRVKEERGAAEKKAAALREYGRWGKTGHWFRRMHIRMRAHLKPFNSGLLAGEALVAPFFGAGRVQHAKLPVCVDQAFPRSASLERRR